MKKKKVYIFLKKTFFTLASFLLFEIGLHAQTADSSLKSKQEIKVEKLLDTDETLLYVGEKVLYQLKKKLHLSDEEDEQEEKKRKEKAKNVKFSLFGITIEKG